MKKFALPTVVSSPFLAALAVFSHSSLFAEEFNFPGTLATGDTAMESGELYDEYPNLKLEAGSLVTIEMKSDSIDSYIVASCKVLDAGLDNDDDILAAEDDESGDARLQMIVEQDSTWAILATTYEPEIKGPYELRVVTQPAAKLQTVTGELNDEDEISLTTGEYCDVIELETEPGGQYGVSLRSGDFDTFIVVHLPDGRLLQNDDGAVGGSSQIVFPGMSGTTKVVLTSFERGETGSYEVTTYSAGAVPAGGGAKSGGVK